MDLEATVNELAPMVLRYCRGRLRDPEAARDLAQTALAALVDRWRRSGPPDSPEAFVFTVARRRAAVAGVRAALRVPLAVLGFRDQPFRDPRPALEARSELERVHAALRRLSRRERQAFLLVVIAELSVSQAAASLGISESAIKMRVSRARQRLSEEVR